MAKGTKEALIDAAELLFAEHGVANTSVRMIASAAGANVAAISFHFGSLAELRKAVLLRRFAPLIDRRLSLLRSLQANVERPSAMQILHAWLDPVLELSRSTDAGEVAFVQILSRTLVEPSPEYAEILADELASHALEFLSAWSSSLPELPKEEIANRLDFIVGAVGHAFTNPSRRTAFLSAEEAADLDRLTPQLLAFIEGGLTAPPSMRRSAGAGAPATRPAKRKRAKLG